MGRIGGVPSVGTLQHKVGSHRVGSDGVPWTWEGAPIDSLLVHDVADSVVANSAISAARANESVIAKAIHS